ncbi:MAG: hypothetical protein DRH08_00320 [Deltaproteobacteria bacterium]|nr:MAG: hypothetical protein DRH08_00320 [Deltaproteobacteria bacterium]
MNGSVNGMCRGCGKPTDSGGKCHDPECVFNKTSLQESYENSANMIRLDDDPEGFRVDTGTVNPGSISFRVAGDREVLRIDPDGGFFVNGNLVTSDMEVYEGFVEWMKAQRLLS